MRERHGVKYAPFALEMLARKEEKKEKNRRENEKQKRRYFYMVREGLNCIGKELLRTLQSRR